MEPPENVKKECSGEDGDDEKKHKCCNCFGRDTIANAAAAVGPAVVNISVSRGMLFNYICLITPPFQFYVILSVLVSPKMLT